jgi:transposase InsO family protein
MGELEAEAGRKKAHTFRSVEEKRRIVEETLKAGVSVSSVGRAHGINANQVFQWRKLYRQGLLDAASGRERIRLLPVVASEEERLPDGRWIRVLTVVDQFTRECLTLCADNTLSGEKVATALDKVIALRGAPQSITVDNGTEFTSKALDLWAYKNGVHLDFIRPRKPVENGYVESFNGKLRDECLNVELFFNLADARRKLYLWRRDYNHHRPHSALDDRTPAEFAAICSRGKDGDETALEDAARLPLSHRTATAVIGKTTTNSTPLLEVLA